MRDRWARHPVACPTCGHMPAWHDAAGCTAWVDYASGVRPCPCGRTLGDLTETGADGGR